MSNWEKKHNIPKVSDLKRTDPQPKPGNRRHKKQYPAHWEIRSSPSWGWGSIYPSKLLKTSTEWHRDEGKYYGKVLCYGQSEEYKLARKLVAEGKLDEGLAIFTKHHPETSDWPVRFINLQPMETAREVLAN
jgi:hypothetical protein